MGIFCQRVCVLRKAAHGPPNGTLPVCKRRTRNKPRMSDKTPRVRDALFHFYCANKTKAFTDPYCPRFHAQRQQIQAKSGHGTRHTHAKKSRARGKNGGAAPASQDVLASQLRWLKYASEDRTYGEGRAAERVAYVTLLKKAELAFCASNRPEANDGAVGRFCQNVCVRNTSSVQNSSLPLCAKLNTSNRKRVRRLRRGNHTARVKRNHTQVKACVGCPTGRNVCVGWQCAIKGRASGYRSAMEARRAALTAEQLEAAPRVHVLDNLNEYTI